MEDEILGRAAGGGRTVRYVITLVVIAIALAAVAIAVFSAGRGVPITSDDANVAYIRDKVGPVILDYLRERGKLPDTLEEAMAATKDKLPHRGDLYRRPLVYVRTGTDSFSVLAYGPNQVYEGGRGDDLIVSYSNGQWSTGAPVIPSVAST